MCDDDGREQGRFRLCSDVRHGLAYYCSSMGPLYNRPFAHWKLSKSTRGKERRAAGRSRGLRGYVYYKVTGRAFVDLLT
jgi:hypothetical protein